MRLDHAQQPLHADRVLQLQPVVGGAVERQDVEGGIAAGPDARGHPHAHVADVLLGRAVDGRPLLDGAVEERLGQRDRGAQVEGEQPLARLLPSGEQPGRAGREDLLHDVVELGNSRANRSSRESG